MAETESRSTEEHESQLAADVGLASVVHDVNQMLAVIVGRTGLLETQVADPSLLAHLRTIGLAARDAGEMLKRLSRQGLPSAVSNCPQSLHEIAEQSRSMVWPQGAPQFKWQNRLDPTWHSQISGQIVREVLNNLLLNSVTAMGEGGEVIVRGTVAANGDAVVVRVSDNGPGLPNEDLEWIFGVGNSGHHNVERGIGLAGCRQLLASAGGQLVAEHQVGGGAVLAMTLPLVSEIPAATPANDSTAALPDAVLLVEDEASVRGMMTDVLVSWGCRVYAYRDAESALADYQTGSAQVAVLDQNLPGQSGTDLASQLRKDDSFMSVVLATGWQKSVDSQAHTNGADFVAAKPLDMADLKHYLQQAFALEQNRKKEMTDDESI